MLQRMTLCAPCLMGVEGLLAEELREMGAEQVRAENGRVLFEGDERTLARACLWCRYGERILILMGEFAAVTFEELFQGVKALPWEEFLGKEDAFPVAGSSLSSRLHSVPDCQAIVKKAVVERLKSKYGLSWFPETGAKHQIRFRLLKDRVSVMIDATGPGLHKRGYRAESSGAPIKETLAAAMAKLSRVRADGTFFDPFCGSGTILIEAAMLARNIAPGLRRSFSAEEWAQGNRSIWREERERGEDLRSRKSDFSAFGWDIDPAAVALTLENAKKAGVEDCIKAQVQDIRQFQGDGPYGCVVCNPPYGERLLDVESAREIYRIMGRVFVRKRGWSYGVITPDGEFEKQFGQKADKRRKLYNGMIQCQYYQYYKTPRK